MARAFSHKDGKRTKLLLQPRLACNARNSDGRGSRAGNMVSGEELASEHGHLPSFRAFV
jgi:hypothetical protein